MTCDKTDNGLGFGTINVTITRSPLGLLSPASHSTRQLLFNSARTAPHDNELNSTSRFSGDFPRRIRRKVMRPIWSLPTIPRTSSLVAHQSIRQGRERSQRRNNRHSYRDLIVNFRINIARRKVVLIGSLYLGRRGQKW